MPFELPFYETKLNEWLVASRVEPSEENVAALAQLLGTVIQTFVKAIVKYVALPYKSSSRPTQSKSKNPKGEGRTIQPNDILFALETIYDGKIPKPVLQAKTAMRTILPKSSFNRAVRSLGDIMLKIDSLRLRWGLEALAMIQRGVEWYVRTRIEKAKVQSKRYYNDKSYSVHSHVRRRSRSTSRSKSRGRKRGRSKATKPLPTSNVYRYLK